MENNPQIAFDALLNLALQENARRELAALPTPAELTAQYPDTARWDARLQKALTAQQRKGRPLKLLRKTALTLAVVLALCSGLLLVNAEVRHAAYNALLQWTNIEVRLTYDVDGPPLTALPDGYTDHVVLDGFVLDEENILDMTDMFVHGYDKMVDGIKKSYTVDCYVIQPTGQISTFDNEHTVYTTVVIDGTEATLGTSVDMDGNTGYYLFWEKDGICNVINGNVTFDEIMKIAEGVY